MEKKTLILDELIVGNPHGQHVKLSAGGWELCQAPNMRRAALTFYQDVPAMTLYDGNGTDRLHLTLAGNGTPVLSFADGNGIERLSCGVLEEGDAHVTLYDATGIRAELALASEGETALTMYGCDEKERLTLSVTADGTPDIETFAPSEEQVPPTPHTKRRFGPKPEAPDVLRAQRFELVDDGGRVRAVLGFNVEREPGLSLRAKAGGEVAGFSLNDGDPALFFSDGNVRLCLNLWDGNPEIFLSDGKMNDRLKLGVDDKGDAYLVTLDAKEHELWSAPTQPAPAEEEEKKEDA